VPFAARADVRLSLVWFLYMAGFGLYFPYWSLYLKDNAGLPEAEAGLVIAVLSLMGIVAQPFWGQIADRTGSRTRVLTVAALGSAFGFCVLWQAHGFLPLLAANALFAAFHTAVLPMAVAVSLATLRDASRHAFGIVRAIGTVGFVVTTFCFPRVLDAVQAARGWTPVPGGPREPGLELLFPTAAAITLCAVAVTFLLPRTGAVSLRAGRGDWRALARHRPYLRIAALCMAAYLFTNGPMLFFPQLVMARGGSLATVSNMWVPMIALEIPGLALSGVLVQRLGARGLIVIGLLAGGARWALCGFVPSMDVVYASCLLHGVTIAGLGMGAPLYAESVVPEKLRATGQGLLATSVHVGAMLSAALTGAVAGRFGIDVPYQAGGLATLALALLVPAILPLPRRPD
jgi:PPP family 3-phenylpropionic acid transporter